MRRLRRSSKATLVFLYDNPLYALIGLAISVVFFEIIFWSLNLSLAWFLFTSPQLDLIDKLELIVGTYANIFRLPLAPLTTLIFIVSLVQGAIIAAIAYLMRLNVQANKSTSKLFGNVGAAGALSVLGLGCVPCGASLLAPLLAIIVGTSAPALVEDVGEIAAVLALVVSLYALFIVGERLADSTVSI